MVDFLEVLDAERTQLQAENRLAQTPHGRCHQPDRAYTKLWAVVGAMHPLPRYTRAASR